MNIKILAVSAIALSTAFSGSSLAAEATATATGTVIEPLVVTKTADLAFGNFAAGAGGTVTISTGGAASASGAVLSTVGSARTAAAFTVAGQDDATYSIAIPGINLTSAANTMALVPVWDFDATTADSPATGLLTGTEIDTISVGGTLTVAAAQPAGAYTGNLVVTVNYN